MKTYYYMSTGEKSYFYTLNVCFTETIYVPTYCPTGLCHMPKEVIRHHFIRNLGHDFQESIARLQQLETELELENVIYLDSPFAMNAREKCAIEARNETIGKGILQSGKYIGSHVSEVPESYVLWNVLNTYHPENNNILGHICYNYADSQGWLKEWITKGKEISANLHTVKVEQIKNCLENEIFMIGKYKGQTFNDIAYTQKGAINKNVLNYYDFLKSSISLRDVDMDFKDDEDVMNFSDTNIDNSQLTLIMFRNALHKRGIKGRHSYEFVEPENTTVNKPLSDIEAIQVYNKHK